jgi:hypothetical protein
MIGMREIGKRISFTLDHRHILRHMSFTYGSQEFWK